MELPFQGRDPGPQSERIKTAIALGPGRANRARFTRPRPSCRFSASVPAGLSGGLPVSVQLIPRRDADADAPAAAAAVCGCVP